MTSPERAADWTVLAAIQRNAGTALDDGYGDALASALKHLERPGVRRVFLADGLVNAADAPLSLEAGHTTWVEWRGGVGGDMLATKAGAAAAAFIEPIAGGTFAGGCSVSFYAGLGGTILPIPGRVVVTNHAGRGLSPVDALREASGVPTAEQASAAQLEHMDRALCRFLDGSIYLRCAPDRDTTAIPDEPGCRTWAGPDLRSALSNTAVELDHTTGLLAAERPEPVREAARKFMALQLGYGTRATLRLLATLSIRCH